MKFQLDAKDIARRRASRSRKNTAFAVVCWASASVSVIVLGILLYSIIKQGMHFLDWDFIKGLPSRNPEDAGMWPSIVGSIFICAICAAVALPLGVGTAIFLEEYRPRQEWLRKLHGFVQLNITNLAGVPSIVYGIIGLTVFVQMFNLFGNPNKPAWEIGATYFDQTTDEAGNYLEFPVDSRKQPTITLQSGTEVRTDRDEIVTLKLVSNDELNALYDTIDERAAELPDEEYEAGYAAIRNEVMAGVIGPNPYIDRVKTKSWYYIQLPFGRGVMAGGLTLMLVILPVVIVSSQEALRSVPPSLREGAFGLGATKWQVVRRTVLPAAVPGIMTGAILAISRAIGEAAPILILAGIVYITFTPGNAMDDFTAMPLQIFNWAGRPEEAFHELAASGIIVLLAVLLSFNAVAVFVRQKFQKDLN